MSDKPKISDYKPLHHYITDTEMDDLSTKAYSALDNGEQAIADFWKKMEKEGRKCKYGNKCRMGCKV